MIIHPSHILSALGLCLKVSIKAFRFRIQLRSVYTAIQYGFQMKWKVYIRVCQLTTGDIKISVAWTSLHCCWSWSQTWRQAVSWTRAAHRCQPHRNWFSMTVRNIKGMQISINILVTSWPSNYLAAFTDPIGYPSCLQTVVATSASTVPSPQTAPHLPLKYTSSLPSEGNSPPTKRTWPE